MSMRDYTWSCWRCVRTERGEERTSMTDTFVNTLVSHTMTIDMARGPQSSRMAHLCTDLFQIVLRMRDAEDLGAPAALRKLILHYLALFERNCRAARIEPECIDDARYAVVALVDETVLSVPGASRDYWLTRPLQLELFGEALAGEEFYNRCQRLLKTGAAAWQVLEVYYLCLSLGFEGKYRLAGAGERDELIAAIGRVLIDKRKIASDRLSPRGRMAAIADTGCGRRPWFVRYLPAFGSAAAVAGVWLYCLWSSRSALTHAVLGLGAMIGR
ncbi:MAG: hypothetical protein GF331_18235 [Chitinivibrionales bacterium]|nr:hypothetical protein [Chitinivibrionales bacterium]